MAVLPVVAAVVTIASGAFAVVSQIQQGQQQASQARAQAAEARAAGRAQQQAAEFNAKVAENNAQAARDAAKVREDIVRRRSERTTAQGQALLAGSGVDIQSGSPLLLAMDDAANAEVAALRERFIGDIEARNQLAIASGARFEGSVRDEEGQFTSRLLRLQARQVRNDSFFGAGATLLGTAAQSFRVFNRGESPARSTAGQPLEEGFF